MRASIRPLGSLGSRFFRRTVAAVSLAALASAGAAGNAAAAVTILGQIRTVTTFATLDSAEGEDQFTNDIFQSFEPGPFEEAALCHVGVPGDQANSTGHQLSYVEPDGILAEGNMSGQSEISEASNFAEGFGMSRIVVTFSVDETTPARVQATLIAGGNGAANFTFRVPNGTIFINRSIHDDSETLDETLQLAAGTYELTAVTSGYGQALPNGGGQPASGSFSTSVHFTSPTSAASIASGAAAQRAPIVAPNPVRSTARILPGIGGTQLVGSATWVADDDGSIVIVDLAGRVVRRFAEVGAGGVTWDSRDASGHPVAAGVYLVRGAAGASTRAVVVR